MNSSCSSLLYCLAAIASWSFTYTTTRSGRLAHWRSLALSQSLSQSRSTSCSRRCRPCSRSVVVAGEKRSATRSTLSWSAAPSRQVNFHAVLAPMMPAPSTHTFILPYVLFWLLCPFVRTSLIIADRTKWTYVGCKLIELCTELISSALLSEASLSLSHLLPYESLSLSPAVS